MALTGVTPTQLRRPNCTGPVASTHRNTDPATFLADPAMSLVALRFCSVIVKGWKYLGAL